MIVEKEVIRPGTYWYRDEKTGEPRKLVVTPELTRYWHDQGNAMLATGLTVPVPCEHDFNAHPMTPAQKLKNNAGWIKEYRMRGDRLFAATDIQDPEIAKRLPTTIKWTSPWINSFTDGNGREWKNVISHLALTTRPRIVEQQPFGSVAAALSMASPIRGWDEVSDGGLCLSRAGLLVDDEPAYPIAFSMWAGGVQLDGGAAFAWSEKARAAALEARRRKSAAKKSATPSRTMKNRGNRTRRHVHSDAALHASQQMSGDDSHHGSEASAHADDAAHHSSRDNSEEAHKSHGLAAIHHVEAAKEHHAAGRHEEAHFHAEAASKHFKAAKSHAAHVSKGGAKMGIDDDDEDDDLEDDDAGSDDDTSAQPQQPTQPQQPDDGGVDVDQDGDTDVTMEELLCDLLGALGIACEHGGSEQAFRRNLYNAVMTKIHELTNKGAGQPDEPVRDNPPGQPPNNPKPAPGGAKPNPILQQEQQPMYMSLEEIQKLPEPMRSVALSMFEENRRLQAEVTASKKVTDGLLNAKLKEADGARRSRVALLGKLSPKVMQDLGAMLEDPRMALSIGDNGGIIDPMAHTLSVLEKGLADLPRLMTTDVSALSVQRQPLDSEMLDDVRTTEIADNFSRMMGVPPTPPARAG